MFSQLFSYLPQPYSKSVIAFLNFIFIAKDGTCTLKTSTSNLFGERIIKTIKIKCDDENEVNGETNPNPSEVGEEKVVPEESPIGVGEVAIKRRKGSRAVEKELVKSVGGGKEEGGVKGDLEGTTAEVLSDVLDVDLSDLVEGRVNGNVGVIKDVKGGLAMGRRMLSTEGSETSGNRHETEDVDNTFDIRNQVVGDSNIVEEYNRYDGYDNNEYDEHEYNDQYDGHGYPDSEYDLATANESLSLRNESRLLLQRIVGVNFVHSEPEWHSPKTKWRRVKRVVKKKPSALVRGVSVLCEGA